MAGEERAVAFGTQARGGIKGPMVSGASRLQVDDVLQRVPRDFRRFPQLVGGAVRLTWRAAPKEFLLAGAIQMASALAVGGQLLVGRRVLAGVIAVGEGASAATVVPDLILLAVLTAIMVAGRLTHSTLVRLLTERTAYYATRQVLEVTTTVDLVAFESPEFHDRLLRAHINAQARPAHMAAGMLGLVSATLAIIAVAGGLLLLQPEILALVVVGYLPGWLATRRASRAAYEFAVAQTQPDRRRAYISSVLAGKDEAKEIRAYGLRAYFLRQFDRLYAERLAGLRRLVRTTLIWNLAGSLLTSLVTAGTFGLLVWFVASGRTSLAVAGAAAAGVVLLGQRLDTVASSIGTLYESSLFIEDFTTFIVPPPPPPGRRTAPARFDRIDLEDVWFQYPSAEQPSVRGINLHVGAGEVVALVGENGSGKTTLAKILAGLYEPSRGTVRWDGTDSTEFDPAQLRESVAVLFQDFIKYFMTARANVEAGRHDRADDPDGVLRAARLAGADEFIDRLPRGYDTLLGPQFFGGTDLSVGQWQRVALARGIFRDAPLLILDEPTASLDARAEARVFESIRTAFDGRSVVLISHRFSSVRSADRIYVLHDGQIIEEGNHEQLMAQGGRYAELFTIQASAYLDLKAR